MRALHAHCPAHGRGSTPFTLLAPRTEQVGKAEGQRRGCAVRRHGRCGGRAGSP